MSQYDERPDGDERLRAAFQARRASATPRESCPSSADVWSAVHGELSADERRSIVGHTSSCGACAEAWRLAADLTPSLPKRRLWHRTLAPLATAAALVLALAGGFWLWRAPARVETPGFRGGDAPVVRSLVGENEALPRQDFRLRWSGPEGSLYDVRVTTEALQVLAGVQRLAEPSFLVPESTLNPLPPDSKILWRVEAVLPDGERVASPTFVTRLE